MRMPPCCSGQKWKYLQLMLIWTMKTLRVTMWTLSRISLSSKIRMLRSLSWVQASKRTRRSTLHYYRTKSLALTTHTSFMKSTIAMKWWPSTRISSTRFKWCSRLRILKLLNQVRRGQQLNSSKGLMTLHPSTRSSLFSSSIRRVPSQTQGLKLVRSTQAPGQSRQPFQDTQKKSWHLWRETSLAMRQT